MVAQRLTSIRESFIREMTRLAITHNAINLSQGFPDFEPPAELIEAAHQALDSGQNQYTITWGTQPLRQAIALKMGRLYGLEYAPNHHITVTCGVTEAIYATIMSLADPGDEIIVIEPYHEGYVPAIAFASARPVFVSLDPPDYKVDLEKLRLAITPRARAIIVNSPHNPTGRVFTLDELTGIAEICREFDLVAITDEIYEHIIYSDIPHYPLATLPGMWERTVTLGGFGKTFAVTGWRLGYACAPEHLSNGLRTVHDFSTLCAPAPLQAACAVALQMPDTYYQQLKIDYTARRDKMMSILREVKLAAKPPEGAYYVMADFSAWGFEGDDFDFARWLPANLGVAVVPGSCFYGTTGLGKNTIRFAFAKKLETLEAAGERLCQRWRS